MRNKRLWAVVLAATLTATSLTGCGKTAISQETKESVKEMDEMAEAFDRAGISVHSDISGKEETVYVIMDANGSKNETIVSEWLKNPDGADNMVDITALSDIEVVKGKATYTQDAEGNMQWNTAGGDVYYQGRTDKELPVEVKVSYELDGQPVNAEALKDVSGHVKIRYDYENKISKRMEIGDETVNIYQPFTMITGILLDDEKVSNIKVTDGKVINTGSFTAVFGVAMPGLSESIGLDKLKEEKDTDIEIPDSVTIEADVTDFTMPMSMTMATNDAISTLKLDENSDKIDELKEKSDELTDGMDELTDGAEKLDDGTHELRNGTDELQNGVNDLDDGAFELMDGAHKLFDGTVELKDGAWKLYDGTNSLHEGTIALRDGVSKLNGKTPELADGVSQLASGANSLNDGLKQVTDNNEALTTGANSLSAGLKQLNDSVNDPSTAAKLTALKDGSTQVRGGISQLGTGAEQLKAGADQAYAGAQYLRDGLCGIQGQLKDDYGLTAESTDGVINMLDGMITAIDDPSDPESIKLSKIKGMLQVYEGLVFEKMPEVAGKASDLADGIGQVAAGASQINDGLNGATGLVAMYPQVDDGIGTVVESMSAISSGVSQLNAGAATLATGVTNYTNGVTQIGDGAKKLKNGTDTLNSKIPELVKGVSDLNDGASRLESGACTLNNGAGDLFDGVGKLKDGAFDLANGTDELKDGTSKLRNGAVELSDGVIQLVDGTGKLKDGVIKLNDEGISKITDLIGNDIENYYDRIEAVKDFSKEYTTFTGSPANTDGTVKFIYKTDAVK